MNKPIASMNPHDTPAVSNPIMRFLDRHAAYVLVLPTVVAIVLINLYPLLYAAVLSFQEAKLGTAAPIFIGLDNYRRLMADPEIWNAIRITLIFTLFSVVGSVLIGLGLALLLNSGFRGRGIVRSLFIIPWAIPAFVAALIWAWMFNDQFGIINAGLKQLGIARPPIWLDRNNAIWSLILVMIWKSFPFQLVVMLAGLQSIPAEMYDAAAVDGANSRQAFWSITLPLLRPVAMVSILLASINAFHYFPIPWILTGGGPSKATNVLAIEAYTVAFNAGDMGYGAAGAMLMFFFIMIGALVYVRLYINEMRTYEK